MGRLPGELTGCRLVGAGILNSAWDSDAVAASEKFVAVPMQGGGGPVCVLRHDQTGKLSAPPTISGHKGQVLDMCFNPFEPNMLCTGSDDTTVKLWNVPDGGLTENLHADAAVAELSGHAKKVGVLGWNPSAANVLATSSIDKTVKIWDVETGQETFSLDDFSNYPTSMAWSYDGGSMAVVTKDKKAHMIDPREQAIMSTVEGSHAGAKSQRVCWLGNKNLIFTFGFSRSSGRELKVWDPKKMDAPVWQDEVDVASGVLMPMYDQDLHVLYLGGKGDGNIRYFEVKDDGSLFYLSQFSANSPQAGLCSVPKRGLNVMGCEVARLIKMEKDVVKPISFVLPRKGESFQEVSHPPRPPLAAQSFGARVRD